MKKILNSIFLKMKTIHLNDLILVTVGILLALLFRYFIRTFSTQDFENAPKIWYETIKSHGFAAVGILNFNNGNYSYSPIYLYLLYFSSVIFPKIATISAVKLVSVTFDLVEAFFVYKIVRLRFQQGPVPSLAAIGFLFAPTILLNSSVWGQADSIYAAFLLATLYFILRKQNWWACLAYGLAFSMKFQSIFFAPFLLVLLIKKDISWKQILLIPAVYFVLCIPAWIAGRPILDLLTIYFSQANQYHRFFLNFPNIYYSLPGNLYDRFLSAALVLAAGVAFIYIASVYKSRVKMTIPIMILLALVSIVFMPFFLPGMHDRYLYPADALSIVFAFYFPEYFLIPVGINLFSFFVYEKYLFSVINIPGYILQLVFAFVVIYLGKITITTLYSSHNTLNHSDVDPEAADLPVDLQGVNQTTLKD